MKKKKSAPAKPAKTTGAAKKEKNKCFKRVLCIYAGLFAILIIYLVYFIAGVEKSNILNNPYNTRVNLLAKRISRGNIYGRNGEILAETITDENGDEIRYYPFGSLFVHTVGYNSHGKSGVEYMMNYELLKTEEGFFKKIAKDFKGEKYAGNHVYTTLDAALQKAAYDALGDNIGAVVVIEPSTGKILAMVSKPDFDPNNIADLWSELTEEKNAALLNRATQGLYEPGSVFKIITALSYIREYPDTWKEFSYNCKNGIYNDGGAKISCYHNRAHGKNTLAGAFALSCNGAFANMGSQIPLDRIKETCSMLGMNKVLNTGVASHINRFALNEGSEKWEYLQTVIGQGETAINPYFAAMLASAIANGGTAMSPYMVERVTAFDGKILKEYAPTVYDSWLTEDEAEILGEFMRGCVTSGTASALKSVKAECYGKTGTAETQADKPNAWFVGYAVKDGRADIAISVIVEESGSGSEYAVPVAAAVFKAYYGER